MGKNMSKPIVKKTQHGDDIFFKMENDKLMVLYKAVCNKYVLMTEFVENNILSRHEIDVLTNGSEEFGLRLIFKPTLIKTKK
jgi:hypothetical protein